MRLKDTSRELLRAVVSVKPAPLGRANSNFWPNLPLTTVPNPPVLTFDGDSVAGINHRCRWDGVQFIRGAGAMYPPVAELSESFNETVN